MRYQVLDPFKVKTSQGERELKAGQVISLSHDKAFRLLSEGKLKPFCYWLKSIVDNCQMPCFEIEAKIVNYECPNFRGYRMNERRMNIW